MTEAVRTENLQVKFGEHTALENISFAVPKGAFVSIVGPNGSGKSTLIRTLIGVQKAHSGSVLIDGQDAENADPKRIGYVPQMKTFSRNFPGSGMEFVVSGMRRSWPFFMKKAEKEHAMEALRKSGGVHLADKQLSVCSGGELQRIYLARCLVHSPSLLLLDEPMTGIDAAGEADIYRILDSAKGDATIIMVTHDLQTAMHHSSHVLVLNRKLIAFGEPSESLTGRVLENAFGHAGHSHPPFEGISHE